MTSAHHVARARSDIRVRVALEALARFAQELPDPRLKIPEQRRPPEASERRRAGRAGT
ncbi:hypothetical protein [uncultured Deinococcus sp.]|uniref:hypothetical protein n=1 Tax=uncultured Deinococcus sp. TaxID=158789 RepID=UPI0026002590|nr:hypothetical protein [uncultured Deinococcus sp.]